MLHTTKHKYDYTAIKRWRATVSGHEAYKRYQRQYQRAYYNTPEKRLKKAALHRAYMARLKIEHPRKYQHHLAMGVIRNRRNRRYRQRRRETIKVKNASVATKIQS